MFRTFARVPNVGAQKLFRFIHRLARGADCRDRRAEATASALGHPLHRSDLTRFEDTWFGRRALTPPAPTPPPSRPTQPDLNALINGMAREVNHVLWDHLIYAYMIENAHLRISIAPPSFAGGKLGAGLETLHWLRNTEGCSRDAPSSSFSLHSAVRLMVKPSAAAPTIACSAHGPESRDADNKPIRSPGRCREQVRQHLRGALREVDQHHQRLQPSGTKSTDDAKLTELMKSSGISRPSERELSRGVRLRRDDVWFHLTVESDSVVVDLRAQASSPEQRLYKIAQQVGVPAHGLSGSYFYIADAISRVLLLVETGVFTTIPNAVAALYTPGSALERLMRTIITHWSIITGRDMKAGKIAPSDAPRRPA
jgi:hypothetical protein